MADVVRLLSFCAVQARWLLALGLLAGIALPAAAATLRPLLPVLIGALLFLSALRIPPERLTSAIAGARGDISIILVMQLALPVAAALAFAALGFTGPLADVLVLMVAAAPIASAPAIAVMCGLDGFAALRLLVWGTLLLPVTSLLPLFMVFAGLEGASVAEAAARLAGLIAIAAGSGLAVRHFLARQIELPMLQAIDGLSAVLLAVFVLALMDAIQPLLFGDPVALIKVLALATIANFGLQLVGRRVAAMLIGSGGIDDRPAAGAIGLIAGNRNIALFLTALPPVLTDPMMVFIGCYQIPMLLTPAILGASYRRFLGGT
ncbi:MAG: hypothetical protein KDJ16_12955 [Hyphomicrobiales bacterium]|nr:hypothetical protein [Hyphomicrobiales bacterium]